MKEKSEASPLPWARGLRLALAALLLLCAAGVLFVQPALSAAVARGALSHRWMLLPVALFVLFFVAFSVDRFWLVKRGRYPGGRAFFQIVFGVVFAALLLPSSLREFASLRPRGDAYLLQHRNPSIRKVSVEALGFRGMRPDRVRALLARTKDEDPEVRAAAYEVLRRWSGQGGDPATVEGWARSVLETSEEGAR